MGKPSGLKSKLLLAMALVGALSSILLFQNCTHKTENNYYTLPESTASSATTPTPTGSQTYTGDTLNGQPISFSLSQPSYSNGVASGTITLNGVSGVVQLTSTNYGSCGTAGGFSVYGAAGVAGNFVYASFVVMDPQAGPSARQYSFKYDVETGKVVGVQDNEVTTSSYLTMATIMSSM